MLKGMHLTLLVGPVVPLPVPQVVLDALTGIEVTNNTEGPSGFQLTFQPPEMGSPRLVTVTLPVKPVLHWFTA